MEKRFAESRCGSKWPVADQEEVEEVAAVENATIAINLVTLLGSARIRVVVEAAEDTLVRHPVVDTLLRHHAVDIPPRPPGEVVADEAIRRVEEVPEAILDRLPEEARARGDEALRHFGVLAAARRRHIDLVLAVQSLTDAKCVSVAEMFCLEACFLFCGLQQGILVAPCISDHVPS